MAFNIEETTMKRFSMMVVIFAMMAAPAVATTLPIGVNGYYVETVANTFVTTSQLAAQAFYNYGIAGATFPAKSVDPYYSGSQAGTLDTTGLATSSFDQTAGVKLPDVIDYGPGPTYTASSYAAASLATGSLHAFGQGVGYSEAQTYAFMSDTLNFTIADATASTVTPIAVHWTLDGTWSYNPISWSGEVDAGLTLGGQVLADMLGDNLHPLAFVGAPDTGQSGWDSFSYASDTFTDIDFTGVYDLVGASATLPFSMSLLVWPGGGLSADGLTAFATSIDFSNTGQVGLILPSNVTFTSDSGVFLTSQSSAVPEPATLSLVILPLLGMGFVRWRRRA